jgi:hypothetical protein
MPSASKQDKWFVDKVSKKTYRAVWINDKTALLESDHSVQILTSIGILETYYEPLEI